MTGRIRWTELAELDVVDAWNYLADANYDAAGELVYRIHAKCQKLADHPRSGVRRPDVHPLIRSSPIGNYVIYYKPAEDGITVLRVIHGARNVEEIGFDAGGG